MNPKNATSHPTYFGTLFLILLSSQSCISTKNISSKTLNEEWKREKTEKIEHPTWEIYSRQISGTSMLEYKIIGDISSTPETCIATFKQDLFNDTLNLKKFPTYNITTESDTSFLTYVIHNEPFPLKDTEMSIRYSFSANDSNGRSVKWKEDWEACSIESSKRLNRVTTFRGTWYFSPISDNLVSARNSVQFDPGKMPSWMFEPMIFKFLKEGLEDLRKESSD